MNQQALDRANEAIFHNQMSTEQAVRYVAKQAEVDMSTARQAVQTVMIGYKKQ